MPGIARRPPHFKPYWARFAFLVYTVAMGHRVMNGQPRTRKARVLTCGYAVPQLSPRLSFITAASALLSVGSPAWATTTPAEATTGAAPSRPPTEWRAAYAGELLTHPGAAVGLTRVLALSRTWSGFRHSLVVTPEVGFYDHPRNHVGAFVDVALGWQLSHRSGARFTAQAAAGYLHTWLAGPVYTVDDAGVHKVHDAGRPHLMLALPIELGWRVPCSRERWLSPFLRLTPFARYPYDGTFLPQALVELGIAFPLALFEPTGKESGHQ